jgi:hypothetical protein
MITTIFSSIRAFFVVIGSMKFLFSVNITAWCTNYRFAERYTTTAVTIKDGHNR